MFGTARLELQSTVPATENPPPRNSCPFLRNLPGHVLTDAFRSNQALDVNVTAVTVEINAPYDNRHQRKAKAVSQSKENKTTKWGRSRN